MILRILTKRSDGVTETWHAAAALIRTHNTHRYIHNTNFSPNQAMIFKVGGGILNIMIKKAVPQRRESRYARSLPKLRELQCT